MQKSMLVLQIKVYLQYCKLHTYAVFYIIWNWHVDVELLMCKVENISFILFVQTNIKFYVIIHEI